MPETVQQSTDAAPPRNSYLSIYEESGETHIYIKAWSPSSDELGFSIVSLFVAFIEVAAASTWGTTALEALPLILVLVAMSQNTIWGLWGAQEIIPTRDELAIVWHCGLFHFTRRYATKGMAVFTIEKKRTKNWRVGQRVELEGLFKTPDLFGVSFRYKGAMTPKLFAVGVTLTEAEGVAALVSQRTGIPWQNKVK